MLQNPAAFSKEAPADSRVLQTLLAVTVVLVGVSVILGWSLNLPMFKTVLPGLTTMKANTALAFIAAGTSLLLTPASAERNAVADLRRDFATACGAITFGLGALTLAEYAIGVSLGIDEFFSPDPQTTSFPFPGRMAPATAICFAFIGLACCLLARADCVSRAVGRCFALIAHGLTLAPAALGYLILAGYAYDVEGFYRFGPYVSVALHAGALFVLLSFAILFTSPDLGWRRFFNNSPVALHLLIRLVPISLLVPFIAGAFVVWGAKARLYDPLFAPALLALAAAASAAGSAWFAVGAVRRAEVELAQSEQRFRDLVEAMPNMAFITLPDGFNIFQNQRWSDYTGIPQKDAVGEKWAEALHVDDVAKTWTAWKAALETGEAYNIEHRLRGSDGQYRWFLTRAVALRENGKKAIFRWFGTSTDISEIVAARESLAQSRAELERRIDDRTLELQESQSQLAHAQRMDALGQLAGGIAHDVNNVLQGVLGGASLIKRRPGDKEQVGTLANMIIEAAQRGAAITRQLLAFSRRDDLQAEPIDAGCLLNGVREILAHTLGVGVVVTIEAEDDLPRLMADRRQLEIVLINLAKNASDAMHGAGELRLIASREVNPRQIGTRRMLKAGTYICISVADKGDGMTPEVLARVSEPFFTTKEIGKGTGLGLAMASGFAKQSGGSLLIESAPGQGTVVRLWLPIATDGEAASESSLAVTQGGATGKKARVLVVEDDSIVRETLVQQLMDEGYDVSFAADGKEALALLDTDQGIDLIVTDLSMPGLDGLAVLREAKRRKPLMPAILLTGFATDATDIGADCDYTLVRKPIDAKALTIQMASMLKEVEG
jgi:PAS domain S-box-containing protein